MNTSITKKAYARGIGESLQRQGVIQFPNNDFLKQAADQAASLISAEPAAQAVSDEDCVKVAQYLAGVNEDLRQRGKTASWPQGVSLAVDARTAIGDMITKVAEEVTGQSGGKRPTAVGMADHSNDLAAASGESDLAAKERKERPEGYAHTGQGNNNIKEDSDARIGKEQDHPKKPKRPEGPSNSVEQASKSASVADTLRKLAQGDKSTTVGMGDHDNDLNAAAQEHDVNAQEAINRPEGYANVGQGNANIGESSDARIGEEQAHPKQPADAPGTNSVEQASKSASVEKLAQARQIGRDSVDTVLQGLAQNFG